MFSESLEALFEVVQGNDQILILTHNNPDPDAIGGAIALRYLLAECVGIKAQIAYKGIIGRAENQALIRYLNYPLQHINRSLLKANPSFALVDTQPGAGNNALPPQANVAIVIDHHFWREATAAAKFSDVRPHVGSTSTIMVEYLRSIGLEPDSSLATALFYGIKTDTMGLSRGTTSSDMSAICYLLPLIDLEALLNIERAEVPLTYFESFATVLQTTRIYKDVVVAYIEAMPYPDLTAEMADFLLRLKNIHWVICLGIYKKNLIISVRTKNRRGAGQMIQEVIGDKGVAGGHGAMAGGQIPLNNEDPKQLVTDLQQRLLQYLKIPLEEKGKPLTGHKPI